MFGAGSELGGSKLLHTERYYYCEPLLCSDNVPPSAFVRGAYCNESLLAAAVYRHPKVQLV